MLAISLWVNDENMGRDVNVEICKRNIYFNGEHISRENRICIFTKISELKEIECEEFNYVEVNNVKLLRCAYIEIKDAHMNFMNKEGVLLSYLPMREIDRLTLVAIDRIMIIADEK